MARNDPVPASDDVTRWIKPTWVKRTDDGEAERTPAGEIAQIVPQAFELREGEEYLSVTWLQAFGAERSVHLPLAAEAYRRSQTSKKLGLNGVFAIAGVETLSDACKKHGAKIRILQEPEDENPGHVAVRRFPAEAGDLHVYLATEIFVERYTYKEIKASGAGTAD